MLEKEINKLTGKFFGAVRGCRFFVDPDEFVVPSKSWLKFADIKIVRGAISHLTESIGNYSKDLCFEHRVNCRSRISCPNRQEHSTDSSHIHRAFWIFGKIELNWGRLIRACRQYALNCLPKILNAC